MVTLLSNVVHTDGMIVLCIVILKAIGHLHPRHPTYALYALATQTGSMATLSVCEPILV